MKSQSSQFCFFFFGLSQRRYQWCLSGHTQLTSSRRGAGGRGPCLTACPFSEKHFYRRVERARNLWVVYVVFFTGGAYTSDEVSQVSVLINYQNHNISDCLSQNWIESNRIGDQINNRKQWWYPALVFQTLFIYWTLPAQPSPGFTEKGLKKRTYPASLLSESTLLMSDVRGEWPHY